MIFTSLTEKKRRTKEMWRKHSFESFSSNGIMFRNRALLRQMCFNIFNCIVTSWNFDFENCKAWKLKWRQQPQRYDETKRIEMKKKICKNTHQTLSCRHTHTHTYRKWNDELFIKYSLNDFIQAMLFVAFQNTLMN